jgi:hypothetical protein
VQLSAAQKWNFDPSTHGIFAQIDAFVQRCANLIEVCEGAVASALRKLAVELGVAMQFMCA